MKINLLSRSDSGAGGYVAVYRLYQALKQAGMSPTLLVGKQQKSDSVLIGKTKISAFWDNLTPPLDRLLLTPYRRRLPTLFSPQWVPDRLGFALRKLKPDIVNLHWINQGFLQIETLAKLPYPLVWTSHDMWGFTGGCHYTGECDRYLHTCGDCPQLNSQKDRDLSRWIWERKAKAWKTIPLTIVTPSQWLADCAKASSLFRDKRIEVIPNGLDIQVYKPSDRPYARERLNLPQDKYLILFGAINATGDRRKGFHLLQPALHHLSQTHSSNNIELVIFGSSRPQQEPNLGFKTHYFGQLKDDIALSLLYAAVDIFIAPSLQDNLPNTVMESLACGTPAVAFNIGGMPDMIQHQHNGYLAQPFDSQDLANGIKWVLENPERHQHLSHQARQKAQEAFTLQIQAQNYLRLFQDVIDRYREIKHQE